MSAAAVPEWVDYAVKIGEGLVPIVTFLLGKATKSAVDQGRLDQAVKDIAFLQEQVRSNTSTLAAHTSLHEGYVTMQKQILEIDRKLNQVCGRLNIDGVR